MDTGAFDMFHNSRDYNIFPITYRVYFCLCSLQILIDQNRVILCITGDDIHEFFNFLIRKSDLHPLSAQYIGRAHQHRISEPVCNFFCLFCGINGRTCCPCDLGFFENLIENLTIFRCVYIFCIRSKDLNTHFHQILCQLDRCLSTELNNRAIRFFLSDNIFHIFWC